MKKKSFLILAVVFLSLIFAACKTTSSVEDTNEQWIPVTNIDQLRGTWFCDEGRIIFPQEFQNEEYLLIVGKEVDDSKLWMNYASKYNIPIKQAWAKRYAAIAEVYGINYPLVDSNKIQRGIKFSTPKIFTDYYIEVITHMDTLIPEDVVFKNLGFFYISKDGSQLKTSGTFRYFSSKFKNDYVEEQIYTKR